MRYYMIRNKVHSEIMHLNKLDLAHIFFINNYWYIRVFTWVFTLNSIVAKTATIKNPPNYGRPIECIRKEKLKVIHDA